MATGITIIQGIPVREVEEFGCALPGWCLRHGYDTGFVGFEEHGPGTLTLYGTPASGTGEHAAMVAGIASAARAFGFSYQPSKAR